MTQQTKTLYTARVRTCGGRDGTCRSLDGRLDLRLSRPGASASGTNPEQLFAAGWSACFEGALAEGARRLKIDLVSEPIIDTEIDLDLVEGAYRLAARLRVSLPGLDRDLAQRLIEEAHLTCPFSKATRGNIEVAATLA